MIEDIRPDLARWVTPHAEWKPEEDLLDESYREVASVLHVAPDTLRERTRQALLPLLDLPVELVLPAHRNAVLEGGCQALARALDR
jgi:hypothetical protein